MRAQWSGLGDFAWINRPAHGTWGSWVLALKHLRRRISSFILVGSKTSICCDDSANRSSFLVSWRGWARYDVLAIQEAQCNNITSTTHHPLNDKFRLSLRVAMEYLAQLYFTQRGLLLLGQYPSIFTVLLPPPSHQQRPRPRLEVAANFQHY